MNTAARPPRSSFAPPVIAGLAAAAMALSALVFSALSACAAGSTLPPDPPSPAESAAAPGDELEDETVMSWKEIERLIEEQKMREALDGVAARLEAARATGESEEIVRALVERAKLTLALSGHETAVEDLRAAERPEEPRAQLVLDLLYGQSLIQYLEWYRWEIDQRERLADVADEGEIDLKLLTRDQILTEAHRAYARAWAVRDSWGREPVTELKLYIEPNNYPPGIRGTVRDAVSYLWADLLADSSWWRPDHANDVFRLDFAELIDGAPLAEERLADPELHPLPRLAAVLGDLERWHGAAGKTEAAFEARRQRLIALRAHAGDREKDSLAADLEAALDRLGGGHPWWSMGMATRAQWVQGEEAPDNSVRALAIAEAGHERHPESPGGRTCQALASTIRAPSFSLEGMASDGAGRRSVRVNHRNMQRIFFRAYRSDVLTRLEGSTSRRLAPERNEIPALLGRRPDSEWEVELPATPDFRQRGTFVVPPLDTPGLYTLVASARQGFGEKDNQRIALNVVVTSMALLTRIDGEGFDVTVRDGVTGALQPEVEVVLYRADWKSGHRRVGRELTDGEGRARLEALAVRRTPRDRFFVAARRGGDVAIDSAHKSLFQPRSQTTETAALLYTDRSVYRPGQELQWKVVSYAAGARGTDYRVQPNQEVTVVLLDAHGQEVERRVTESNDFGSAVGRFSIPAGRPLGNWTLRAEDSGSSRWVQVEEYKRPTFEVTLADPEEELRLNRPARLRGDARYYFGLPVAEGEVRWTVVRQPLYSHHWRAGWWPIPGGSQAQTVAAGSSELGADGSFELEFLPEVDEREARPGLTYAYRLSAEVTDAGGETRGAARSYRLGFVSVEARLASGRGFWPAGEAPSLSVSRTDLNGQPRAGVGRWRLLEVEQPDRAVPPADQPWPRPPGGEGAAGSRTPPQRTRWNPRYGVGDTVRAWPDGEQVAAGEVEHGDQGPAEISLPALGAGVYRLFYSTDDAFGATFETSQDLIVAADGSPPIALPALLLAERSALQVGETLRLLVGSGLAEQDLVLELSRDREIVERRVFEAPSDAPMSSRVLEIPVTPAFRGGLGVRLVGLADYQPMVLDVPIVVPWDDRRLQVRWASFRDQLRPGGRETWRVEVSGADEETLAAGAAEVLAYMYDRSLDLFAAHQTPDLSSVYPQWLGRMAAPQTNLGPAYAVWQVRDGFGDVLRSPVLRGDRIELHSSYGIGGPGVRGGQMAVASTMARAREESPVPPPPAAAEPAAEVADALYAADSPESSGGARKARAAGPGSADAEPSPAPRSRFAETAFWEPQLLTREDGSVAFEFTVPDSVTEWNVWAHAVTRDLRMGSERVQARTVKELLVRPYVPRFLRERDRAELRVVVNNAGERTLSGEVEIRAIDPQTGEDRSAELGLAAVDGKLMAPFEVAPDGSATVGFALTAPAAVGSYALEVWARSGDLADGERRPLPVLPGRLYLSESRFAALSGEDRRTLSFAGLAAQAGADADPTLLSDRLVVTLDGQLFYSVLSALPYLIDYPYECTEQTLNRFVSTGVVASVFERYPAVAAMAAKLAAERDTRLESWEEDDPNRNLLLEETPWLRRSRGGIGSGGDGETEPGLIKVLDPRIAAAERDAALARLEEAQTASGGFPWWPGGPPSPYMTAYMLHGLSRAIERGVEVPQPMVQSAWRYLHGWWSAEVYRKLEAGESCCVELTTFLGYVLSSYPDAGWTGGVFDEDDRRRMLDHSFDHWQGHAPLLKGYLALTLQRAGRREDAELVFDAVLDSSRTDPDLGTYWAPEDRGWLWYNDTVEGHAFALYTLTELAPGDARRHGLVQWLMLDKKLGHWKSTRATAEAIWALVHYLEQEGSLAAVEEARVTVGPVAESFRFEPDEYTGARNRVVVEGPRVDPAAMSTIVVEKETPGLLFASATWHFSTDRLPASGSQEGLFSVRRSYYRRVHDGREWTLEPLRGGDHLAVGDQVEVQLSIRARHAAEYVHLRDPRGAGFEPHSLTSGYRWKTGIGYYEEVRDSGTNFFIEWLPAGEYTLIHRLRAATAGTFRSGPATLQSMYAPEFTAYSSGRELQVAGEAPE